MKQFALQSCFYVLPRHINIMTDKGINIFDECATSVTTGRGVHIFFLRGQ